MNSSSRMKEETPLWLSVSE